MKKRLLYAEDAAGVSVDGNAGGMIYVFPRQSSQPDIFRQVVNSVHKKEHFSAQRRITKTRSDCMTLRSHVAIALLMILFSSAAGAHHNMSALFDFDNRVTATGTLTRADWRNPHIQLTVEVNKDGQTETWTFEGPPPVFFKERDITKADFEGAFGKTVTVEASRARDGSKTGLLRTMTLPGGKFVSACPQNC